MSRKTTILLSSGSGTDATQKEIATLDIPAQSVAVAELPTLASDPVCANSITIRTADASPGEILTDVLASSERGAASATLTLPWKDEQQFDNAGEHPWKIGDSLSSTVLLFNPDANTENDSVALLVHSGQTVWTKQLSIPPLATISISLNQIVSQQEPDGNGQKLPPDGREGIVTWYTLKQPRIFGKLVQYDHVSGISRTYACGYGEIVCGVEVPDTYIVAGQQETIYYDLDSCQSPSDHYECNCFDEDGCERGGVRPQRMVWSSDDSNIASPADQWGTWQGNSVGDTYANVTAWDYNGCSGDGWGSVHVIGYGCFAQLKYRPIPQVPQYNHSFWWIQNSAGAHYIIDGGPAPDGCIAGGNCYLNDWVTFGDVGSHFMNPTDNANDATAWNTGTAGSLCPAVNALYTFALGWPQNISNYFFLGPNSNTFAHQCANAAGWWFVTAPPSAPGW